MKIAAFTGSRTISSRRFRVEQIVPLLNAEGIEVSEFIARFGAWPPHSKVVRPFWFFATLADRFGPVLASQSYDLVFLQREFVSTLYTMERFTKRPRVLDVDDAIWLGSARAGRNFGRLAASCDGIVCGNDYIAEQVSRWNKNTVIVPTAVDIVRFHPVEERKFGKTVIGWSGLYAGSKYICGIERSLKRLLDDRSDITLRITSDRRPNFQSIKEDQYEFIPWSPENEVRTIQSFDIGLMPIDDSDWSRGKCSYKMLLYMACGKPVVVSPFGMNKQVLARGEIGIGATDDLDWYEGLELLTESPALREVMGKNARKVVEAEFSLTSASKKLADYFKTFL